MAETLKEKTAKGLFWGAMNNGAMQVIGLVFGIVLGRLLSPSDYGMIAMITVFSLIANALQNSGFITAITNIKEPTDNDYNSVFWFNISVGGFLYLVLFLCAPLIAGYYHLRHWFHFAGMHSCHCYSPAFVRLSRLISSSI